MGCAFCANEEVRVRNYPTLLYGRRDLCRPCLVEQLRPRTKRRKRPSRPKRQAPAKDMPGQLLFPFMQTDGPDEAVCSQISKP